MSSRYGRSGLDATSRGSGSDRRPAPPHAPSGSPGRDPAPPPGGSCTGQAGVAELVEVCLRRVDHEVAVEETLRHGAEAPDHDRTERDRGTKCPSMMSTWMTSACGSTSFTSSPRRARSAASIDAESFPHDAGIVPVASGPSTSGDEGGRSVERRHEHAVRAMPVRPQTMALRGPVPDPGWRGSAGRCAGGGALRQTASVSALGKVHTE